MYLTVRRTTLSNDSLNGNGEARTPQSGMLFSFKTVRSLPHRWSNCVQFCQISQWNMERKWCPCFSFLRPKSKIIVKSTNHAMEPLQLRSLKKHVSFRHISENCLYMFRLNTWNHSPSSSNQPTGGTPQQGRTHDHSRHVRCAQWASPSQRN